MAEDKLLSLSFASALGSKKTHLVPFANAKTFAEISAFALLYVPIVEAISDAYVVSASITEPVDISGVTKGVSDGPARTNDGARFLFDTPARYGFGLWVPAIKAALVGNVDVDQADAAIIAFKNALVTGLGGHAPTDGSGNDLTALLKAVVAYRK